MTILFDQDNFSFLGQRDHIDPGAAFDDVWIEDTAIQGLALIDPKSHSFSLV
jgi:hypothetical protein